MTSVSLQRHKPFSSCALAQPRLAPARYQQQLVHRLAVLRSAPAPPGPTDVPKADASAPAPAPQPAALSDLAKDALRQTVSGEKTTAKDVLGEGTLNQLKTALGEERAGQFISALDGLLANRRLATLIFAVIDVVLIVVAIKFFRSTFMHE
ncbi:hypothetical protein HYH03_012444 [Edaphochlamys debaryana]|uniref:Uncharacterized protein n=1 Tax=Edaphochlamys debaryana TaxID=47281 RepID=A0A835XY42_9CHLO|nr:hypothetical protein HYH03_012444 [Edaphochlamys debaryana]|eukprot:KAG2489005.1 hypothetical protein HYH03_012444 [Edaphochlamys debaryana]